MTAEWRWTLVQYSLLFYLSEEDFAARKDPRKREAFWSAFVPYHKALQEAGIVVAGTGLQAPDTATTLRRQSDRHVVQDGPYAEVKEQLGGFYIIDVPDLDTALRWAGKYPGNVMEVRPTLHMPE